MLTKLALLSLLIIAVFYGGRALTRLAQATTTSTSRRSRDKQASSATQLEECPRCGAYVPGGRCNCGQRNEHSG